MIVGWGPENLANPKFICDMFCQYVKFRGPQTLVIFYILCSHPFLVHNFDPMGPWELVFWLIAAFPFGNLPSDWPFEELAMDLLEIRRCNDSSEWSSSWWLTYPSEKY